MGSLFSRDELRRLEKAAREKDKNKLGEWLMQFEQSLSMTLKRDYEKEYAEERSNMLNNILTGVTYALYYSEENYIDKHNIGEFMADLFTTLDMFRTGEYRPEDYAEQLKEEGIELDTYDCDLIYKKVLNMYDTDLVNYLKRQSRKIMTICGSTRYLDEMRQIEQDFTLEGYIVLTNGLLDKNLEVAKYEVEQLVNLHMDKILISDVVYVVNKDGYIGNGTLKEIEFAKKHNKEIRYLEPITEEE